MSSLTSEGRFLLQRYKLVFEEHRLIKERFNTGSRDLHAHLNIFQEKLSTKIKNQKERFEKQFFSQDQVEVEAKRNDLEKENVPLDPSWVKKIYRDIVLSTHPDKTSFIAVESVKKKFSDHYHLAVESYNSKAYENLLFVANDIGIEVEDEKVKQVVTPRIDLLEAEVKRIKQTVAYEWFGITEDKKLQTLSNYLRSFGYVFGEEIVKEVIEKAKRIKRKRGTKPVNYIRKRIK